MTTGVDGYGSGIVPNSAWLLARTGGVSLTPVELGQRAPLEQARGSVVAFAPNYAPGSGPLVEAPTISPQGSPADPAPRPGIGLGLLGRAAGLVGMLLIPTNSEGSVTEIVGQPDMRLFRAPGDLQYSVQTRVDGEWRATGTALPTNGSGLGGWIGGVGDIAARLGHETGNYVVVIPGRDGAPDRGFAISVQSQAEADLVAEGLARGLDATSIQQNIDLHRFRLDRPTIPTETLRDLGPPPPSMRNPHVHHVLPLNGRVGEERELIREGQAILREVGIDPTVGRHNLVWAPNKGHTLEATRDLVEALRAVRGSRVDVERVLVDYGQQAAQR